ncbi:PGDYG domain-containing protein [Aliarcobacter cryaerophilus]|uniref:Uncharacterized protein n=1 Tax=Aliarcobacter cryaerophilus TaxID=28198 RepID=A0A2S9SL12_9BACT|nr:PGDYG domain-containing protein [Aliarcobacter cryaerophilus]MCT7539585.1 hypothetical protein [Aliarcobacter cryaerophilus]PRM87252.1 hypothetical protein CJ671_10265 [Aliarcobacter cryaerophilus]PRM96816.1 hypothetical protein CJ670_07360 [Arcobacter cryaerophilus gv. crypticus]
MLIIKNDEDFFNLISNSESGLVKPIPVVLNYEIAKNDCLIQTLEGLQNVSKDDFIMTGLEGEQYCIIKEKFHKKYTILESDIKDINFAKKNISENTIYRFIKSNLNLNVRINNNIFKISNQDFLIRYEKNDFGIIKNNLFSKLYIKI